MTQIKAAVPVEPLECRFLLSLSHVKASGATSWVNCILVNKIAPVSVFPLMTTILERSSSRPLVIVVDDDRAVRNSLKFSLEIEGFSVRTYSDGHELLSGGHAATSSCLIVDYNLSGISGLETIARLREEHVNVPAILVTSHPTAATTENARRAHIPIVEKPFLGNALIDQVRAAVRHGQDGIEAS